MNEAKRRAPSFETEELIPPEESVLGASGFWCATCRATRVSRSVSGLCETCPGGEPLYDLGNSQMRADALQAIEEARLATTRSYYIQASAIAFILAATIAGVHILIYHTFADDLADILGRFAGRLAIPIEATLVTPLVPRIARWLMRMDARRS